MTSHRCSSSTFLAEALAGPSVRYVRGGPREFKRACLAAERHNDCLDGWQVQIKWNDGSEHTLRVGCRNKDGSFSCSYPLEAGARRDIHLAQCKLGAFKAPQ